MSDQQIYSATYSNVPVFEFVTDEGPIMRRKKDSWINATHILKIAKFPKAKRTRILEKDVQTGVHEKVQGGYGKYQGTYVPLTLGIELAKSFDVYEVLRPIFEFNYVEGKSTTPPPAPKHNHASASNVANKNAALGSRKAKASNSINEPPRKRGRPKRVTLNQPPVLNKNDTAPINESKLTRQDTENDALNMMANNMNHIQLQSVSRLNSSHIPQHARFQTQSIKDDDLELDNSSDNDDESAFLTGKELFGTPRNSFERIVNNHNYNQTSFRGVPQYLPGGANIHNTPTLVPGHSRTNSHDPYSLSQYHHPHQNNNLQSFKDDNTYNEYFSNLLNFFLEDNNQQETNLNPNLSDDNDDDNATNDSKPIIKKAKDTVIPKGLLNPPQPISKININQPIDNDGNTIFHWACSMGNYTIIDFLINNFPNIINSNLKNNNGETPLMFLIKFSNSYQLKNFPNLLDLLFDSALSVDNSNKTVLHHIALSVAPPGIADPSNEDSQLGNYLKNKERIARYYIECLFQKIMEFQEFNNNDEQSNSLIKKFINHQDNDGNTAFHLIAYNLNKKLIKVFIGYHKFIDFSIKNLVNYSAEEYLASHNYVLKLEDDDSQQPMKITGANSKSFSFQSFESQLYYSKMTVNMSNSTSNLITERLTELNFLIDRELNEKDEKILKLINVNAKFHSHKLMQQKLILKIFKLDHLIKDVEEEIELLDRNRDTIIQDEINRFLNDLTFQVLQKKEILDSKMKLYKSTYMKLNSAKVNKTENTTSDTKLSDDKVELAILLQQEIIKSDKLLNDLIKIQAQVPNFSKEEFKENNLNNQKSSIMTHIPSDDKLNKYCKLISLCCGMDINDVESSIDSIEQSLMNSMNQK